MLHALLRCRGASKCLLTLGTAKGGFYSESEIRFLDIQISKTKYSEKLSWAWNLNLLFTVFGGKFKFQAQDSFSEYFFLEIWRSKKMNHTYWKKAPLVCLISEEDTINDNKVQNLQKKIYAKILFY